MCTCTRWFQDRGVDDEEELHEKRHPLRYWGLLAALVAALGLLFSGPGFGQALDKPYFVVATAKLDGDPFWRRTVILARPVGSGHVGLVLNKPSPMTMGRLFPYHAPSMAVTDPVYIGGPHSLESIFALIKAEASPGPGSTEFMPGLWLVITTAVIDKIIETTPNEARYFAGFVWWRPSLLEDELARGLMIVLPADADKAMRRDTSNLYDELVRTTFYYHRAVH